MTQERNPQPGAPVELGRSVPTQVVVCAVFALVGAGAGWLIKVLADWFVTLEWAPMQGPAKLVANAPDPWITVGLIGGGALLGLIAGIVVQISELSLTVSADGIDLVRGDETQHVDGKDAAAAFLDHGHLVVLDHSSAELAREKTDLDRKALAAAFTAHGYTWSDADPHEDEYRLWFPETPDLPEGANAILRARATLLKQKDSEAELKEMRRELVHLGVVVRDKEKRQYWRPVQPRT